MGVLKNGVGRPSNETIRKRNILKVVCIVLVLIIIGLIVYILNDKGIINVKKDNKKATENNTKKETVNVDDAKKELDRFVLNNDYSFMIDNKMNDDYKGYLAITKSKSQKKNYTCKEMFGNDIEPYGGSDAPDNHSWQVGGLCNDSEAIDFYEYETVNKEYMKLFGKTLSKKTVQPNMETHYEYSKTKNGFTFISCECGDMSTIAESKIYEAYKENNELHIIFSIIPFVPSDDGVNGIEVYLDSRELSYSIEKDAKYDAENIKITNADELFEKYKDKLPKYEFVLTKKDGSYIYKSFSEVK